VAGAPSCAPIAITSTILFNFARPQLAATLLADRTKAAGGDAVAFTSTVSNIGAILDTQAHIDVENVSASTFVVQGWQLVYEYQAVPGGQWTPFARAAFDAAGTLVPETTLVPIAFSFIDPGNVAGRTIAPSATVRWGIEIIPVIPPDVLAVIFDPAQSSGIRMVARFDVPSGPAPSGISPLAYPGLDLDVDNVTAQLGFAFISAAGQVPASGPLTSSGSGPLAPGGSRIYSGTFAAPLLPAFPLFPGETETQYRSRLIFATNGYRPTVIVNGQSTPNPLEIAKPLDLPFELPRFMNMQKTGPATVPAGFAATYTVALPNSGNGVASALTISDAIDGQPVTISALSAPTTVSAGATGTATFKAGSALERSPGPMTDVATLTWQDRNGNVYGPLSASFTNASTPGHPEGYLSLAALAPDVPHLVGATKELTVTALDPYGSPAPGVSVHFVVTGPHAQTTDIVTGADGKATFSYQGAVIGVDKAVATATITTTVVTTNTLEIQWATAVGTACTGRATPLDVMLVVDVSASMALEPPYSIASATSGKLEAALVAANRFIDNLSPTRDQVGLVVFRGIVDQFAALSSNATEAKTKLATGIEGGIFCATNSCNPLEGGSDLALGLDRALDELESPRHRAEAQKVVVYVGDGGIAGDPTSEIARLHASGARAIVLTVGSLIEGGVVARQVASTINDYFYAPSAAGIDYAFNSLNQDLCRNRAPHVSAGGDQGLYNVRLPSSLPLLGEVHDDGASGDQRLTSEWTVISGPGAATIVDPTSPVTDVLFFEPGTYVLQLAASDGYLTVADRATITVDPDPSIVGASLAVALSAPGPLETGQTETLTATLLDGLGAPIRNFVLTATVAGANPIITTLLTNDDGVAVFSYQGAKPGTDILHATAIGSTLHLDSSNVSVQWVQPTTGGPKLTQGWIGAPAHQSPVMGRVPIELAQDVTLASGTVKYAPTSNPTAVQTLATGVSGGPGSLLATFDTTLVANDTYVIELAGTDQAGNEKTSTVLVTVTGDYKPGRVVVEVVDFTVPIAGLPITVGRRYDSLEKDKMGDFGHGWSLSIAHPRVETNPDFSVSLTLPNRRRATFGLQIAMSPAQIVAGPFNPFPGVYFTSYQAEPGVFGTLTQEGGCPAVRYNPNDADNPIPCFFTFGFVPDNRYAPERFTYTDPYGTAYRMAASGALESITDRQGNSLTFQPNGIISSSGRSVTFVRDAEGRITKATTPPFQGQFALGSAEYKYTYDGAGDLVTVEAPDSNPFVTELTHYTYASHRLLTTQDPHGNLARTSTYDASGRLASDKDALNNLTTYTYNLETRTTTTTFPDDGEVTQAFDARGLLVAETNQLGHTTTYEYDAHRNQTKRTNALGEVTTATYDNGNQRFVTDPLGTTETQYNAQNLPVWFKDRVNHVTEIEYDDRGVPARIYDSEGTRFKFTNSEQGLPLIVEDAAGKRAYIEYDAAGNVTGRTDWLGRVTRATYDKMGNRTTETSARGDVTIHTYGIDGRLASTRNSVNYLVDRRYDGNGNLGVEEDNLGRHTITTYNPLNFVTQQVRTPAGATVSYTRDFRGNPLTMTDEGGRTTTYEYDKAGQLKKTIFPDGTFTERTYDPLGRLATSKDERGNVTTYAYQAGCGCSDRVTSVTDPLGHTTTTTYDANGRRSSVKDASNRTTSFVYDVRGRLIETHYADGTVTSEGYDARGRRTSITDQMGKTMLYGYDDQGQLTSVTDPLENVTAYGYDLDGNLTSVTDANNHTTTYEYDLLKRKTKRTLPMSTEQSPQFETFAYDMAGRQTGHTDFRGKTTTMTYDSRDRMLTKVPDASLGELSQSYTYSPTGMRLTATKGSDTTTYTYDLRDRMLTKAATAGTLTYTYDPAGNLATIRSSNTNGTSVDYTWDAANQLTSITDNRIGGGTTSTATYTPTSRPATLAQPNGVGLMYSYDTLTDRLISLAWRQGTSPNPFASWAYQYNGRGQRRFATDVTTRTAEYTYDYAGRLTGETITNDPRGGSFNGVLSYVLDAVGNRSSRASTLAALGAQSFAYNANDEISGDTVDANGNTISSGGHTYAYDFDNRLVSKDGGAVVVQYDCDGNRVAKTVGGVTTRYLVDDLNPTGYLQVLEEVSGGAVLTRYTYGDRIVSQTRNVSATAATSYYGFDAHGNITFLTDEAGAVTDAYDYDAWGNLVASTGSTPNTRLYVGEEFDPDLGLINLRARQYTAELGRFLTLDPLVGDPTKPLAGNRYLYAEVDPANRIDPLGLMAEYRATMGASAALAAPASITVGVGGEIGTATIATTAGRILGVALACAFVNVSGASPEAVLAAAALARSPLMATLAVCAKPKSCYEKYLEDTADCGSTYTIDYNYDKCMNAAWQNYIRCLNGARRKPFTG
jgi:RHS repeat-associated protein